MIWFDDDLRSVYMHSAKAISLDTVEPVLTLRKTTKHIEIGGVHQTFHLYYCIYYTIKY